MIHTHIYDTYMIQMMNRLRMRVFLTLLSCLAAASASTLLQVVVVFIIVIVIKLVNDISASS